MAPLAEMAEWAERALRNGVTLHQLAACSYMSPTIPIPWDILSNIGADSSLTERLQSMVVSSSEERGTTNSGAVVDELGLHISSDFQQAVTGAMAPLSLFKALRAALIALDESFPDRADEVENWESAGILVPHVLSATSASQEMAVVIPSELSLQTKLGDFFRGKGEYSASEHHLGIALSLSLQCWPTGDARRAPTHVAVGQLQLELGRFDKAEAEFRTAIQCLADGDDELGLAVAKQGLGEALGLLDRYEESLVCLNGVTPILESAPANLRSERVRNLRLIGETLIRLGRLEEAKDQAELARRMCETLLGPNHPEAAAVDAVFGDLAMNSRDYRAARKGYERALQASRASLGEHHPAVGVFLSNLSDALAWENEQGAFDAIEEALEIGTEKLPGNHPALAIRNFKLGRLQESRGQLVEAGASFAASLRIHESILMPDDPSIARDRMAIASALGKIDPTPTIIKNLGGAYAFYQKGPGATTPQAIAVKVALVEALFDSLESAAKVLDILDRSAEAVEVRSTAFSSMESLGKKIADIDAAMPFVKACIDRGLVESAEEVLEAITKGFSFVDGPDERAAALMGVAWHSVARHLENEGRFDEALAAYQRSLPLMRSDEESGGIILHDIGDVLAEQGKFQPAAEHYQLAADAKKSGGDPSSLAVTLLALGRALRHLGDTDEAVSVFSLCIDVLQKDSQHSQLEGVAWHEKGLTLQQCGKYDEAASVFEQSIDRKRDSSNDADRIGSQLALARVLREGQQHLRAIQVLRDALCSAAEMGPRGTALRGTIHGELGTNYSALSEPGAAADAFLLALNLGRQIRSDSRDLLRLGYSASKSLQAAGRKDEAIVVLGDLVTSGVSVKSDSSSEFLLAACFALSGELLADRRDFMRSVQHCERAFTLSGDPHLPLWFGSGLVKALQRSPGSLKAQQILRTLELVAGDAISSHGSLDDGELLNLLAAGRTMAALGDFETATKGLELATDSDLEEESQFILFGAWVELGRNLLSKERLPEARAAYAAAVSRMPAEMLPQAQLELDFAFLEWSDDNPLTALAHFRRGGQLFESNGSPTLSLVCSIWVAWCSLLLGNSDEARVNARSALGSLIVLECQPFLFAHLNRLGTVLHALGMFSDAEVLGTIFVQTANRYLTLDVEERAWALRELGHALRALDRLEEAEDCFVAAKSIDLKPADFTPTGLANDYLALAIIAQKRGHLSQAEDFAYEALRAVERRDEVEAADLVPSYLAIASVSLDRSRADVASTYFRRALDVLLGGTRIRAASTMKNARFGGQLFRLAHSLTPGDPELDRDFARLQRRIVWSTTPKLPMSRRAKGDGAYPGRDDETAWL